MEILITHSVSLQISKENREKTRERKLRFNLQSKIFKEGVQVGAHFLLYISR